MLTVFVGSKASTLESKGIGRFKTGSLATGGLNMTSWLGWFFAFSQSSRHCKLLEVHLIPSDLGWDSSRTWEASWPLTTSMVRWNKTVRPQQFGAWRYGEDYQTHVEYQGFAQWQWEYQQDRNCALYYCTIFFLKIPVSFSSTVGYCRYFFGCTRCNPRDKKTMIVLPR